MCQPKSGSREAAACLLEHESCVPVVLALRFRLEPDRSEEGICLELYVVMCSAVSSFSSVTEVSALDCVSSMD